MRAMTFNIHHGVGVDGRLDLQRTAETIESQQIDVVGLQEVDRRFADRSEFADQARVLSRMLGMRLAYGAALDLEPASPGRTTAQIRQRDPGSQPHRQAQQRTAAAHGRGRATGVATRADRYRWPRAGCLHDPSGGARHRTAGVTGWRSGDQYRVPGRTVRPACRPERSARLGRDGRDHRRPAGCLDRRERPRIHLPGHRANPAHRRRTALTGCSPDGGICRCRDRVGSSTARRRLRVIGLGGRG